jgi:hypothetical protein
LGELRSLYGWPSPEDPEGSRDEELTAREMIADRMRDEVQWLRDSSLALVPSRTSSTPRSIPGCAAERRRRLAEPPLAFPTHGRSIRQYRQALYEFEKAEPVSLLSQKALDRTVGQRPSHYPLSRAAAAALYRDARS